MSIPFSNLQTPPVPDLSTLDISSSALGPIPSPFPATTKSISTTINSIPTTLTSLSFTDKLLFTISQNGKLSQWIQVPLSTTPETQFSTALPTDDLLPATHITPKTMLGGGGEEREAIGHFLATQIANVVQVRDPDERRTVVCGFGLEGDMIKVLRGGEGDSGREEFFDLMEAIGKVL